MSNLMYTRFRMKEDLIAFAEAQGWTDMGSNGGGERYQAEDGSCYVRDLAGGQFYWRKTSGPLKVIS